MPRFRLRHALYTTFIAALFAAYFASKGCCGRESPVTLERAAPGV